MQTRLKQWEKGKVREKVGAFLHGRSTRTEEVKPRCRTVLRAQAEAVETATTPMLQAPQHGDPTLALF